MQIWTIGHSTHSREAFAALLTENSIRALADVRRFPSSRRHPQFNEKSLAEFLSSQGIAYFHLVELGGRRTPTPNSPNTGWREEAFRGYADHMETREFQNGIQRLLSIAAEHPTAIMCAEAAWQHCHRALLSDYLKAHGHSVIHILGPAKNQEHSYTSPARIVENRLTYAPPATQTEFGLL